MASKHEVPPHSEELQVSFPADHVLLLTLNRPKKLNSMSPTLTRGLNSLLNWFDEESDLWVVVLTGAGRAFCAGADLVAWNKEQNGDRPFNQQEGLIASVHGFASISRRTVTSKPIIAAVNGGAYGGGMELLTNCDLIIASDNAIFQLPEVKRGVVAGQGGIPRLFQAAGYQRAAEMLLLGRPITATDARDRFQFVNAVVPYSELLKTAVAWAVEITQNSPDSVQSTKRALLLSRGPVEEIVREHTWAPESKRAYTGQNIKEGLKAFVEKRAPKWSNPAKL